MTHNTPHLDLGELLSRLIDDSLDESSSSALAELLKNDPAARQQYRDHLSLHTVLYWKSDRSLGDTSSDATEIDDFGIQTESHELVDRAAQDPKPRRSLSLLQRVSRRPIPPSVAVSVLIVAAGLMVMAALPVSEFVATLSGGTTVDEPVKREMIAQVIYTKDAQWVRAQDALGQEEDANSSHDVTIGTRLYAGDKLFLVSGLAEIKFDNGAEVLLQEQSAFEALDGERCRLQIGKLVARAPGKRGKGFVVETPHARVEDLGTEFGVVVENSGALQVFVDDGRVQVSDNESPRVRSELAAGQSLSFVPGGRFEVGDANVADRFVWTFSSGAPSQRSGKVLYADRFTPDVSSRPVNKIWRNGETLPISYIGRRQLRNDWHVIGSFALRDATSPPFGGVGKGNEGAARGIAESGGGGMRLPCELPDDFVIQCDARKPPGSKTHDISLGTNELLVTFNLDGTLFVRSEQLAKTVDTQLELPIAQDDTNWHNYAARFDLKGERVLIHIDDQQIASIDLCEHFGQEQPIASASNSVRWQGGWVTQVDNFRVGLPNEQELPDEQGPTGAEQPGDR